MSSLRNKLALTYDNSVLTDGLGAQLQRIYGIYSVSRLLGASYLHSQIARVDYQGLSALEGAAYDPAFLDQIDGLFCIASDMPPAASFHMISRDHLSLEAVNELIAMFDRGETVGRPILVRLLFPYAIADRFPDCYDVCKHVSPFAASPPVGRPLRIALHVRRGELFALSPERMLPNSYYINVGRAVARVLDGLKMGYQIELWTEVPRKRFEIHPDDRNFRDLAGPVVITPEMCRIDEFNELPHLVPCINGPAIDCMGRLATADVLVTSRSSFSYVGGILNKNGIVMYHPFWHPAPSSWIPVARDGAFDQLRFGEAVSAL